MGMVSNENMNIDVRKSMTNNNNNNANKFNRIGHNRSQTGYEFTMKRANNSVSAKFLNHNF